MILSNFCIYYYQPIETAIGTALQEETGETIIGAYRKKRNLKRLQLNEIKAIFIQNFTDPLLFGGIKVALLCSAPPPRGRREEDSAPRTAAELNSMSSRELVGNGLTVHRGTEKAALHLAGCG